MTMLAVDVRSAPIAPGTSVPPERSRCSLIVLPRSSSASQVTSRLRCPSRPSPTATLSGLPPGCSTGGFPGCRMTSISVSPITAAMSVAIACPFIPMWLGGPAFGPPNHSRRLLLQEREAVWVVGVDLLDVRLRHGDRRQLVERHVNHTVVGGVGWLRPRLALL